MSAVQLRVTCPGTGNAAGWRTGRPLRAGLRSRRLGRLWAGRAAV